ncbi:hypothetical protein N657DRAFT_360689 [Parathielavia appendiculata]|uniref:Uncharacterized protein n=1 Tax=Parathielavia appendiculata TaxID=2587402 RepID=A0AAN6U3P7_9PEZI|nr:hypothetical protein N657DRAFT_360689 [Parathielavia appendiculata]
MAAPSNRSHTGRRGLGDRIPKPTTKIRYSPDLQLSDDHPCAPSTPFPIFTPSNAGPWSRRLPATAQEQPGHFPAWEHPPIQRQQYLTSPTTHANHGTSHSQLSRLSSRIYAVRTSDPADFAAPWESSIVPLLAELLRKHCSCDFAVDVHNFPERSSSAVPRLIYITLSGDADTRALEQIIRAELEMAVPERFHPVALEIWRGEVRKSQWWYVPLFLIEQPLQFRVLECQCAQLIHKIDTDLRGDAGTRDMVCPPRNVAYRDTPVIGMSIGPTQVPDAASLGGFVNVRSNLYAMSAFHPFEDAFKAYKLGVMHPAAPDIPLIVPSDPSARPYSIGSVARCAPPGTLRPSLSFQGGRFEEHLTMVEMDWCLIGPVPNGKNIVSVPSFRADRCVAVESTAAVEGNTEVYAMARTSGYSLGFTSDVPGLLEISGQLRREWTVRQYSPIGQSEDDRTSGRWQTLKQWVTSGIGVAGDSGAWLIRRSDNALMGLVWGRNHDCGDPLERVRLTYFTPIVDILADIREEYAEDQDVSLPVYSQGDLARGVETCGPQEIIGFDMSCDPWSMYAQQAVRRQQQVQVDLIQGHFVGDGVPSSWVILPPRQSDGGPALPNTRPRRRQQHGALGSSIPAADPLTTPPQVDGDGFLADPHSQDKLLLRGVGLSPGVDMPLPELTTATSIGTSSSMADKSSEMASAGNGVRIVGDLDIDEEITDVEAPIQAKASFALKYPGSSRLDRVPAQVGSQL